MTGPAVQTDDPILAVVSAVAGEVGERFLARLVEVLRASMDVELAIISEGLGSPPDRIRAIYALDDGASAPHYAYALEDTPCAIVFGEGRQVTVPCGLADQYPDDEGLQSYVAAPLRDAAGAVTGHLALFGRRALDEVGAKRAEALVSLSALRVEAELRRIAYEKEREDLISALTAATHRLRARDARSRAQNAHKTELLGIIAHDMRRPLAAMLTQAELVASLAARDVAPAGRVTRIGTLCDRIVAQCESMGGLIDATLRRVRSEDEALALETRSVALFAIAERAVDAPRARAAEKGLARAIRIDPDRTVDGDEDLLFVALDNLVSNAVKYGLRGGSALVSAEAVDSACVEIAVVDDGQGLDAADLRRAFGRFETLSARPTGGEAATGLGLANVRAIAEAHGGQASVQSAGLGKGARFCVRLPRRASVRAATDAGGAAAPGGPAERMRMGAAVGDAE